MEEGACPVCAAMNGRDSEGLVLVQNELTDARHAEIGEDDATDCAGRIDIRPRRHVARWARLTPAEHADLDRLTVALSLALHHVTGATMVRPVDISHEENVAAHLVRRLQPEFPTPHPDWLADPRWQDHEARQQAVLDLVGRLREHLNAPRSS